MKLYKCPLCLVNEASPPSRSLCFFVQEAGMEPVRFMLLHLQRGFQVLAARPHFISLSVLHCTESCVEDFRLKPDLFSIL